MPKSTMNIGMSELRVGLLVFIALAVLILLVLNASGGLNPFKSHLHLRARFADANGLREGSDVKLAGVKIGKVDRIRLLSPSEVGTAPNPQKIEVFLTIDTKIDGVPATDRIRRDSTAQQAAPSMLGSQRDITAGRGTAGKLVESDEMYNKINHIADRVNHSMDQIDQIIAGVNAGQGTIGKLVKDEAIYNDARTAIARFNTTTTRIDSVVASAQRGEGTLGKLITDEQLYNNVNNLSSEGVKMLYDFRQNPKKYLTIKFQLF